MNRHPSDKRLAETDPWDTVAEARDQRKLLAAGWLRAIVDWAKRPPVLIRPAELRAARSLNPFRSLNT